MTVVRTFRGVRYEVQFSFFRLPEGALIACLLKLYDIPESPYFLHRIFDVSFPPVRKYLGEVAKSGGWVLLLQSRGTEEDVTRGLDLETERLTIHLREADRYNSSLKEVKGLEALEQFLAVFEPEAEKGGCEEGWKAVRRWCEQQGRETSDG